MSSPAERAARPPKADKEAGQDTPKLCSQCGTEPASSTSPAWCKKCRAAYQREYTGTVVDVAERRGFRQGAEAMRKHLVDEFLKAPPSGLMMAGEVAAFIAGTPPPQRADS